MDSKLGQRIYQILQDYVGTITHTSTALENNNQVFFKQYFEQVDYFRQNPDKCGFYPIKNDALGRHVPWALLKGQGRDTLVMIHHCDTVDSDDYGKLKHLAHQPERITRAYADEQADLDADALKDARSGQWLFGRGVADMKGGASIHLALLEAYSRAESFQGNLLLLALPDEENLSAGMLSAIDLMTELQQRHGLEYLLLLNGEPQEREQERFMRLYDGSVGKLMPIFYARGKLAHVGQVYKGLNPIHLMSEVVCATELNFDFSQQVGNTKTPAPTWLYLKDRKEVYDVSLPLAAAGFMSILTLDRPAMDIMEQLKELSTQAFERVLSRSNASYQRYMKDDQARLPFETRVLTYQELYQKALKDSGQAMLDDLAAYQEQARKLIEAGQTTVAGAAFGLIERTVAHLKDSDPLLVLAMSPPYYPHVNNSMLPHKNQQVQQTINHLKDFVEQEMGFHYYMENYFLAISDLSYGMFESSQENIDFIKENMLLWGEIYQIPLEKIRQLSMPVLNIGPWGKDLHKYSERVNLKDLTERIPALVKVAIEKTLGHAEGAKG